jgi:hypothetical protein
MVHRPVSGYDHWMNDNSLVEGEGVNAGAAQQVEEGADNPTGDVRGGGQPQAADPEKDDVTKGDLDPTGPERSHQSDNQDPALSDGGQDSGLME